jgi:hypothetical protein
MRQQRLAVITPAFTHHTHITHTSAYAVITIQTTFDSFPRPQTPTTLVQRKGVLLNGIRIRSSNHKKNKYKNAKRKNAAKTAKKT